MYCLRKQNIFSVKQNIYFNYHPYSTFVYFFSKIVLLNTVHHLHFYKHAKFYGPTLNFATFAFTSKAGVVEGTGLKCVASRSLQWHDLPTQFHKNLQIGSEFQREHSDIQTES